MKTLKSGIQKLTPPSMSSMTRNNLVAVDYLKSKCSLLQNLAALCWELDAQGVMEAFAYPSNRPRICEVIWIGFDNDSYHRLSRLAQ